MIILSIGSNLHSKWGTRFETINRAIIELDKASIKLLERSSPYFSLPMTTNNKAFGLTTSIESGETDDFGLAEFEYINVTLIVECHKTPSQLLYCLKQIERMAGRVAGRRWAARPLDIDIIDYKGIILGHQLEYNQKQHSGFLPLALPHPGLGKRSFVLEPLQQIAPFWHDPITGKTAAQLIHKLK